MDYATSAKLTRLAEVAEEAGEEQLAKEARLIARELKKQEPLIVEQTTFLTKQPTIPDGWSWKDINEETSGKPRFTGDLSGLRLRPGEPFIYQRGHVLFIRQGDLYDHRDQLYFRRISLVPGQAVLIVFGKMGRREGYVFWEDGSESPIIAGGADEIADWIRQWLKSAQRNPMKNWTKESEGL